MILHYKIDLNYIQWNLNSFSRMESRHENYRVTQKLKLPRKRIKKMLFSNQENKNKEFLLFCEKNIFNGRMKNTEWF